MTTLCGAKFMLQVVANGEYLPRPARIDDMQITDDLTDAAVLAEIGERLATLRLERRLTQAELAEQAGVSKRTVERLEAGASSQLTSFIRMLRVLDRVHALDALLPPRGPGPMALLRNRNKAPRRAPRQRPTDAAPGKWTWGEE